MAVRMNKRPTLPSGPDHDAALAQYRRRAAVYDWELAAFEPMIARVFSRP